MSDPTSRSPGPAHNPLTDRVIARLQETRPGPHRRQPDSVRALRRVFLEFGESYRSYRRRTGEPVSAEVRDAALRFRRQLDLGSLVSVAALLERLDTSLVG